MDHTPPVGIARRPRSVGAWVRGARRPRESRSRAPARPYRSASSRATRADLGVDLAAERAAVGERAGRLAAPARTTTRRARGTPARPRSCAACAPSRRAGPRAATSAAASCAGPGPCRSAPGPRRGSRPTTHSPSAPAQGDERVRRRPVVGEAAPAERDLWPDHLRRPPSSRARAALADGSTGACATARRRRRPTRRPSATRCTGRGGPASPASPPPDVGAARPGAPQHASRCPACRTRTGCRRGRRSVCPQAAPSASPSIVVTERPATRPTCGHARHPRLAVDPHRAAPALTLRAAAVLRRTDAERLAQRIEQ